jgi:hypothetical protein
MQGLHYSEQAKLAEAHCFLRRRPSYRPAKFSMPHPAPRLIASGPEALSPLADFGRVKVILA